MTGRCFLLHLSAVVSAVAAALSLTVLPNPLAGLVLLLALLVGPGSTIVGWMPRLPPALVAALIPSIGMGIACGGAALAIQTRLWYPYPITWALIVLLLVASAAGAAVSFPAWRQASRWQPPRITAPVSLLLSPAAVVVWAVGQAVSSHGPVGDYGLLVAQPVVGVALAVAVVAFYLGALRSDPVAMGVAIGATILIFRVTPILATPTATPFYAHSHLGVVDLMAQTGRTHPDVDIYSEWPAFFAWMGWFQNLDVISSETVARWFPLAIHLLQALAVLALARGFGLPPRGAAMAAFIAEIANWVGQDYYSPQAVALVMSLTVIATLLTTNLGWCAWVALPLYAAVIPTHQLTPIWALVAAWGVILLRNRRLWPMAIVMAALIGTYVGLRLDVVAPYGLLSTPSVDNASSNITTVGVPGRQFAQLVVRVTALVLWGAALFILLRRLIRRQPVLLRGFLAFSSFAILAGQNYGGEAIFRVFLYSIAGAAVIMADEVEDAITPVRHAAGRMAWVVRAERVLVLPLLLSYSLLGAQAAMGTWTVQRVDPSEVQAAAAVLKVLKPPSIVLQGAPGAPTRSVAEYGDFARNPNQHFDASLIGTRDFDKLSFNEPRDLDQLKDLLGPQQHPLYVVFTPAMRNYARFYGQMSPERYDRFLELIATSPDFERQPGFPEEAQVYLWVGAPTE